jgi:hypothetical protein
MQQQAAQRGQTSPGQQGEQGQPGQQGQTGQQAQGQPSQQPGEQGGRSQGQGQGQAEGGHAAAAARAGAEALREASEDMRAAAGDLRNQAPDQARERSARALDRLQAAERGLREAGPDQQRRAAGDAQLEARQLADRQRQLAGETARLGRGGNADERRRLAGEQQRLAERADALDQRMQQLAAGPSASAQDRQRLAEAAAAAGRARLGDQMRSAADGVRRDDPSAADGEQQHAIARQLDRIADRVGGTPGAGQDPEGRQLADDLAKAKALRERLADLQRQIESARAQAQANAGRPGEGRPDGAPPEAPPDRSGQQAGEGPRGQTGPGEPRRLAELQREYMESMREAGELGQQPLQGSPGTGRAMSTPTGQQMVSSAPGTQAFKQDFSKWDALHKEVALGLEQLEAALSQRVVERAARERLRTGGVDRVPDEYRATVERYYRALAEEPR